MHNKFFFLTILLFLSLSLISCGTEQLALADTAVPQDTTGKPTIIVDATSAGTSINPLVRGTNLPAWLGSGTAENQTFIDRTKAAAPTIIRMPGGSWSNWYDWSHCELNNECPWDWGVLTPTDFINFMQATETEGMFTINNNGTVQDAAALVAFFNGSTSDCREIGVDRRGKDWDRVCDWAQLRADNGNPDPIGVQYWEIGNEIYGGNLAETGGTDCWEFGWEENVWTCDGTEYVEGIGSGASRNEGFIEFRDLMRWVDPTIQVGAVGVTGQAEWSNWGNEVITAAGDQMDFYIIHEYGFWNPPDNNQEALAYPIGRWDFIMDDYQASLDAHAGGRDVPVAITEYNLFSFQDMDNDQLMKETVNMLFMADTMGQMMVTGVDIANQWDLANGEAGNGTDYGLMNAENYNRTPQYYAFPLWGKFGDTMLPVTNPLSAASQLSIYAGRVDADTISVLAINKTGNSITSDIQLNGFGCISSGTADVVQGSGLNSQSVTFNGNSNPSNDLSNAPSQIIDRTASPLNYTFPRYSITVLLLDVSGPTSSITNTGTNVFPAGVVFDEFVYLPIIQKPICQLDFLLNDAKP